MVPYVQEGSTDIMILSCDIVSDIDVSEMHRYHRIKGSAVTMLTAHYDPSVFAPTPGLKQKSSVGKGCIL